MTHQQHFDTIFKIESADDILALPNVTTKREKLRRLYKAGGAEIPQAETEYLDLVNSLCKQYGLPPYFVKGPAHP